MVPSTVPDFFQEETTDALRAQVEWLIREFGVDQAFFEKVLGTDEVTFSGWRECGALLPPGGEETLRDLWRAVLHLLSFLNFDQSRARDLFHKTMPTSPWVEGLPLIPPW